VLLKVKKILGIGTTTLSKNILYFGLDWRHFGDPEFMARAIVDFMTDNEGYIIPIELLSFDANSVGNRVELNWTTASEQNSARFDIERALITNAGKSAFVKIDEVPARGNSATNSDYFAVDKNVSLGNTYAYRLKMIDLNGEFKYSNEQVVVLNANGIMNISDIMPNPVKAEASFDINLAENVKLSIEVIDISGKIVKKIADRVFEKGMNNIKFDTRDLSNGSYKVIIRGDKFVVNKNFTVTR